MLSPLRRRSGAGMTLIEVLTVMCIIGLLTAIAVPQISALASGNAQEIRHRRNAQELAAVCATAEAAGLKFVAANDLEQSIRNIIKGGTPAAGPFQGKGFGVQGLLEEDVQGVQRYLSLRDGRLIYDSSGEMAAAKQ
ncbi:type II secretion system protein [Roseimicrobium gellanilyticum]|nr:type II secretion system protein [Roseimicrobium gellanilyticum]